MVEPKKRMRAKYWGGVCRQCKVILDETNTVRGLRTWCKNCWTRPKVDERVRHRVYVKERDELRREVFEVYGNNCWVCGKRKRVKYLYIDNEGRNLLPVGIKFYHELKRDGWPEGAKVICGDCWLARRWK